MSEFFQFFFQPPLLILFALAVTGLSHLLVDRSEYRHRVDMEWRVTEAWMRGWMKSPDEDLIELSRQRFYERKMLKLPKRPNKQEWEKR